MKLKHLMFSLMALSAVAVGAQNQGYQDGIEYFKTDQLDNAKEILTKTLNDAATNRAEALYYLGAIALEEGNTAQAQKYFEEGIELDPKNGLNYIGLGSLALRNGDSKAAADWFKNATKAQNKAHVNVAVARAYYDADPVAYAKEFDKYMNNATNKDKKDASIYVMRGDVLRDAAVAAGLDDPAAIGEAAAMYNQAIYFNPQSPEAYVKYSRLFAKANPKYAIEKLIELNGLAPNSAMAQRELAERYYDNDQWTRAAEQYGKYINNPNSFKKDKERYAVLLFFGENYDQSLALAQDILKEDPNSLQMKRMLFLNLEKKGDYPGARNAAESFFSMTLPDGVRFTSNDYATYANVLHELGETDAEIAARSKAVEANPEKLELLKDLATANSQAGTAAFSAAQAAAKADTTQAAPDYSLANAYYRAALDAHKRFIDAGDYVTQDLVDLAGRYQNVASSSPADSPERLEAITTAMSLIDDVIERVPGNFIPLLNKARMSVVKNNGEPSQETVDIYQQAIDLMNQDPENLVKRKDTYIQAYNLIGKFYIQEGDFPAAKATYEKYLELAPDNEALRAYIESLDERIKKAAK